MRHFPYTTGPPIDVMNRLVRTTSLTVIKLQGGKLIGVADPAIRPYWAEPLKQGFCPFVALQPGTDSSLCVRWSSVLSEEDVWFITEEYPGSPD